MAQARHLPKTLTKLASSFNVSINPSNSFPIALSSRLLSHRNFHTKAQLTDVDSNPSFSAIAVAHAVIDDGEIEVLGFRRLEDAIRSTIVRNSAPDWLPFLPGSSYWVPPKRRVEKSFFELVGRITDPLTEEESLSLTSSRGWPSSSVFLDGLVSEHPFSVEVEVKVHLQNNPERISSEDED